MATKQDKERAGLPHMSFCSGIYYVLLALLVTGAIYVCKLTNKYYEIIYPVSTNKSSILRRWCPLH